jgi:hypothetical protein
MIKEIKAYRVVCDECGKEYCDDDGSGFAIFAEPSDAAEFADADGWQEHNGMWYCPEHRKIVEDED